MTQCVVCEARNNAMNTAGEVGGPEIAAVNDSKKVCSNSSQTVAVVVGSRNTVNEHTRRETRNDEDHHGKQRRMADSVILVTDDGVELSPGIWPVDSRTSSEFEYNESDDDDGFDDGAIMASEFSSRGDHRDELISQGEIRRQPSDTNNNNALFMAALDKLARRPRQQEMKSAKLQDIIEEEYQSNSSCGVFESDSASTLPSCGNAEIADVPLVHTGGETITVSELNAEIIHDIDSTFASYSNGKAFASQVIQNTNNILNDLVVGSKIGGKSASNSISGGCVSPQSGHGNKSPHFDKLVTRCILNGIASNQPKTTPPRINTPASPFARKRITINNLASGFASAAVASTTRTKQKNNVATGENNMVAQYDADPTTLSGSDVAFESHQRNELPGPLEAVEVRGRETSTDDFFGELRHKSLLAKAISYQNKLEADGYSTKRNNVPTTESLMNIDPTVEPDPVDAPDTTISPRATKLRVESSIPDDEKKYIALKSVREERVVQPFDESPQVQGLSEPTNAVAPSAAFFPSDQLSSKIDTESAISFSPRSAKGRGVSTSSKTESPSVGSVISLPSTVQLQTNQSPQVQGLSEPTNAVAPSAAFFPSDQLSSKIDTESAISFSPRSAKGRGVSTSSKTESPSVGSVISLPSTVQLQTNRIAQLEADALHKHQVAELAAASAREVLEQMIKARKERRDKGDAKIKKTNRMKDAAPTVAKEPTLIHDNDDQLSLCSTLSSDQKAELKYAKVDSSAKIVTKLSEDATSASSDHGNYSAASASQYVVEKRTYILKTPKDEPSMISRDSKSSVADSELSTSTYSTVDDIIASRHYHRHDRTRHRRSSSAVRSRTIDTKTNLFLPTLCTPDSVSSRISEQHPSRSRYRSHSASPRHRLRDMRPIPSATRQAMKPNHLLSYSPRGDIKEARPMFTSMRPEPLSAVDLKSRHHPSMSHHFPEVGLVPPREQYVPSSRMSDFKLNVDTNAAAGVQYHSYGGRSLTPKSVHEQKRYGLRPYEVPNVYRYPTTRSIDALSLAQNQELMMPHQHLKGFATPAAQEQLIMNNYPYSYSNHDAFFPPNPYGGHSITPKSVYEQQQYGFRAYEQQPLHLRRATPRSFDAMSMAHHRHHPHLERSNATIVAGQYGTSASSMHPYNAPAKVSFVDSYDEGITDRSQYLSNAGGHNVQHQSFQQQLPFVLH